MGGLTDTSVNFHFKEFGIFSVCVLKKVPLFSVYSFSIMINHCFTLKHNSKINLDEYLWLQFYDRLRWNMVILDVFIYLKILINWCTLSSLSKKLTWKTICMSYLSLYTMPFINILVSKGAILSINIILVHFCSCPYYCCYLAFVFR